MELNKIKKISSYFNSKTKLNHNRVLKYYNNTYNKLNDGVDQLKKTVFKRKVRNMNIKGAVKGCSYKGRANSGSSNDMTKRFA